MSEWVMESEKLKMVKNFQYTNIPVTNNQKVLF